MLQTREILTVANRNSGISQARQSGGGPPQSKTWRMLFRSLSRDSPATAGECAGPPALFELIRVIREMRG